MEGEPKDTKEEKSAKIRFDFAPGATAQEMFAAIQRLVKEQEEKKENSIEEKS